MGLDAEDAEAGDCQMMLITLRKQRSRVVRAKWLSDTFRAEATRGREKYTKKHSGEQQLIQWMDISVDGQ